MSIEFQVLAPGDLDEILTFAEKRHRDLYPDETERMFQSWVAKWRRESLEHYLRIGWSFVARENAQTVGFFLAQPFLFFRGQTQTLWVELIEARDLGVAEALAEVAVRVAREKNLQRTLFADADRLGPAIGKWAPSPLSDTIAEIKTTKG